MYKWYYGRCFLIAVSNNSLILVPDGITNHSKFEIVQLSKKPIKLLYDCNNNNKDIIVIFEGGYISQLSLAKSALGHDEIAVFGNLNITK